MGWGAGGHYYYGSRNVVMSPDGSRIFWTGAAYDANLNDLGYLGEEIYATTAHGDLAMGAQHAFNSHNGQTLYTWPFSTSVPGGFPATSKKSFCSMPLQNNSSPSP